MRIEELSQCAGGTTTAGGGRPRAGGRCNEAPPDVLAPRSSDGTARGLGASAGGGGCEDGSTSTRSRPSRGFSSHSASHDDAGRHDAQCAQLHSYLDVNTRNGCSICTSGSLATPQPRRLAMRKKSPTSRRAPASSRCAVSHADQHTLQVFRSPLSVKPSRRGGLVRRADSWKFRTLMNGSARSCASHPQPRLSHTALLVITRV